MDFVPFSRGFPLSNLLALAMYCFTSSGFAKSVCLLILFKFCDTLLIVFSAFPLLLRYISVLMISSFCLVDSLRGRRLVRVSAFDLVGILVQILLVWTRIPVFILSNHCFFICLFLV